ncbi:hypothetical protein [Xanthobacter aminoxidans]|uniref:hypothetical protein n=1 Tax=Xanthobacter aminoxidans TaxID=186280 RepID=UPI0020230CA6|nr:hypothetical protein [Xanthobacter aminoxidans]MCL8384158.1 hypothetical protein [Xanthobacter aminoxidans]
MGYIVKATEEHARALAPILRPADRAEIEALTGREPLGVLLEMVREHDAWAMYSDAGELAGMCGVDPIYPPTPDYPGVLKTGTPKLGQPWMMGSDVLDKHTVEFLRASRKWVEEQQARYETLNNVVDARNAKHIQWLKWLGFEVAKEPILWGSKLLPFYPFERTRSTPCASPLFPS